METSVDSAGVAEEVSGSNDGELVFSQQVQDSLRIPGSWTQDAHITCVPTWTGSTPFRLAAEVQFR